MKYYAIPSRPIPLGVSGDNHALQIYFDITDWAAMWMNGSATIIIEQGTDLYTQQLTKTTESTTAGVRTYAVWTITSLTTLRLRNGKVILKYNYDHDSDPSTADYIAQSRIYQIVIDKTIQTTQNTPHYDANGQEIN